MFERLIQRVLLAVVCCSVLVLLPVSNAWAQKDILDDTTQGIQKGAEGVKEGAVTAGEKTKEGAEAVGQGAKDVVTDDDKDTDRDETTTDRMKPSQTESGTTTKQETTTDRMKPSQTQPGSTTSGTTPSGTSSSEERRLPATAGELPLLAFIGVLALISAGALTLVRRTQRN